MATLRICLLLFPCIYYSFLSCAEKVLRFILVAGNRSTEIVFVLFCYYNIHVMKSVLERHLQGLTSLALRLGTFSSARVLILYYSRTLTNVSRFVACPCHVHSPSRGCLERATGALRCVFAPSTPEAQFDSSFVS